MFVAQVGITGHRPSGFSNKAHALTLAADVVDYCIHTYSPVEFNLGGCIGADTWVAQACIDKNISYNLLLPFPADIQGIRWTKEERETLASHILRAKTTSCVGNYYNVSNYYIRDRQIVDRSHIMICFWEGRPTGGTYNTIKYAIKSGKQVFNALNDLQEVSI